MQIESKWMTSVLLPGYIFKGIVATKRQISNIKLFGNPEGRPLYHPLWTHTRVVTQEQFQPLNYLDIRKTQGQGNFLWAITEDSELIVANEFSGLNIPGRGSDRLIHTEVTGLRPVLAAGELKTYDGIIKCINDNTGHYMALNQLITFKKHSHEVMLPCEHSLKLK